MITALYTNQFGRRARVPSACNGRSRARTRHPSGNHRLLATAVGTLWRQLGHPISWDYVYPTTRLGLISLPYGYAGGR